MCPVRGRVTEKAATENILNLNVYSHVLFMVYMYLDFLVVAMSVGA